MPRLAAFARLRPVGTLAILAAALALGPADFALLARGAVALGLEALPVLLMLGLLESLTGTGRPGSEGQRLARRRLARAIACTIARSGCCGPSGTSARAWSPLLVLCTGLAIGWPIALVRAAVALLVDARRSGWRRGSRSTRVEGDRESACGIAAGRRLDNRDESDRCDTGSGGAPADPVRAVCGIVEAGALAGLAVIAIESGPAWLRDAPPGFIAGALTGLIGPCGLGSIALAAASSHVAPYASAGLLATSGIFTTHGLRRSRRGWNERSPRGPRTPRDACAGGDATANALLASTCAIAAHAGGLGLVSPRLVALLWLGAVAATWLAIRRYRFLARRRCGEAVRLPPARARALAFVCAVLAVAALPAVPPLAVAATLADGAPGARFEFTGRVMVTGRFESVERWQVWCCVADASPVAVRLTRSTGLPGGTWVRVSGRFVRTSGGLALDVDRAERIPKPADPYAYA